MTKKRRRPIHLHVMVSEEEQALIQQRMAEAGIRNMGAYMRKMALNGYVLHVDLSPVRELVSLQPVSYTHLDVYKRQLDGAFTALCMASSTRWSRKM